MARVNGFRVTDIGQLRVTTTGPIVSWMGGLPFDANGDLVVQTGTPLPTDPFVGGIRVGEQGVYVTVSGGPPPPSGPMPLYVASDGTAIITMFDTAQYPDVDLFDEVPREAIFNLLATPVDGYTLYPNTGALIADPGEAYIMSPASQVNLTNTTGAMLTGVDLATYINTAATVTIVYDPLLDAITVTP